MMIPNVGMGRGTFQDHLFSFQLFLRDPNLNIMQALGIRHAHIVSEFCFYVFMNLFVASCAKRTLDHTRFTEHTRETFCVEENVDDANVSVHGGVKMKNFKGE